MFNLGMGEITIILVLALIFLGPKKLPELASGLGKLIREIRKTTADVKNEIQLDDAIRKPFEELRDAVTLHPDELKRRDKLRQDLKELEQRIAAEAAAMEANASQSPEPAPADGALSPPHEGGEMSQAASDESMSATPAPEAFGVGHSGAADPATPGDLAVSSSVPSIPPVPTAAPSGTVARTPSSSHAVPPVPPPTAGLARGSGPVSLPERRPVAPPTGSDFVRALRSGADGKRVPSSSPSPLAPDPQSAADRGNTTQALTEADLAAITVSPPPPPVPPGQAATRKLPPTTPRLPGSTPPKNPTTT